MRALTLYLVVASMTVASCGGHDSGSKPAQDATASAAAPAAASAPAASVPPPRDVSAIKACEIMPPQEVSTIVGGRLLNEPPAGFANCAYVVEAGGATEQYRLVFAEPGMYTAMLDVQSEAEKGERVQGLWDEAYLQARQGADGFTLIVIRRGDLALEVSGDRKEPVLEIARLAASRVD